MMIPLINHRITYPYGVKNNRYIKGYHTGVDMASDDYSIHAACPGTIIQARYALGKGADPGGWGNYVILRAADGQHDLIHAHMSSVTISVGQSVTEGTVLGVMGSTGQSTGPHLHFEVRRAPWQDRRDIDPMQFLESLESEVRDVLEHAVLYFGPDDHVVSKRIAERYGNCATFARGADGSINPDALKAKHLVVVGGPKVEHPNVTYLSGQTWFDTTAEVGKFLGY